MLLLAGAAIGLALAAAGFARPRSDMPLGAGAVARVNGEPIRNEDYTRAVAGLAQDRRGGLLDADRRHASTAIDEDSRQRGLRLVLALSDSRCAPTLPPPHRGRGRGRRRAQPTTRSWTTLARERELSSTPRRARTPQSSAGSGRRGSRRARAPRLAAARLRPGSTSPPSAARATRSRAAPLRGPSAAALAIPTDGAPHPARAGPVDVSEPLPREPAITSSGPRPHPDVTPPLARSALGHANSAGALARRRSVVARRSAPRADRGGRSPADSAPTSRRSPPRFDALAHARTLSYTTWTVAAARPPLRCAYAARPLTLSMGTERAPISTASSRRSFARPLHAGATACALPTTCALAARPASSCRVGASAARDRPLRPRANLLFDVPRRLHRARALDGVDLAIACSRLLRACAEQVGRAAWARGYVLLVSTHP